MTVGERRSPPYRHGSRVHDGNAAASSVHGDQPLQDQERPQRANGDVIIRPHIPYTANLREVHTVETIHVFNTTGYYATPTVPHHPR